MFKQIRQLLQSLMVITHICKHKIESDHRYYVYIYLITVVPTGPPTNVRVISRGPTFVTIEWNDPLPEDINDRDGIVLYHIKLNGSKAGSTSERIFTLTDLQPGRKQHIQIIPVNDQGPCLPQHSAMLITSTTIYGMLHFPIGNVICLLLPLFFVNSSSSNGCIHFGSHTHFSKIPNHTLPHKGSIL